MTALRRFALALVLATVITTGLPRVADAAPDGTRDAFGERAATVARWGDCRNPRIRTNGGAYAYSGLVCDLRGRRLNIITFKTKAQEKRWLTLACTGLPTQWVMIGYGFLVTAHDGNRSAAMTGAHVYGGDAYVCSDVVA